MVFKMRREKNKKWSSNLKYKVKGDGREKEIKK